MKEKKLQPTIPAQSLTAGSLEKSKGKTRRLGLSFVSPERQAAARG